MVSWLTPLGVTVKVVGVGVGPGPGPGPGPGAIVTVKVTPWLVMPDSVALILVVTDSEVSLDRAVASP